jgi:flagellar biosynthesis/type III secretory pathway chaperone
MTDPLDELLAILSAEAATYRTLLPLIEEEEQALRRADIQGLAELRGRREDILQRLTELERGRRVAMGRLAARLGVDAGTLTLSRLIELVPRPAAGLAAVRDELRLLLAGLLARNGRNRFLAERTLDCLHGLFGKLAAAVSAPAVYAGSGRTGPAGLDLQLLDRRA